MYCAALRCTALHCASLRCTALHCAALRCTAHCTTHTGVVQCNLHCKAHSVQLHVLMCVCAAFVPSCLQDLALYNLSFGWNCFIPIEILMWRNILEDSNLTGWVGFSFFFILLCILNDIARYAGLLLLEPSAKAFFWPSCKKELFRLFLLILGHFFLFSNKLCNF